jgi:6-phosphogluconate dehydrogenase
MTNFGIIGVGRIGTSLARNMSSNGIKVSLYDKSFDTSTDIQTHYSELESSLVFNDINKFISSISLPRKVLVLVPSGPSLDEVISLCIKKLDSNDILIDAGNTNPTMSFKNHQKIKSKNLLYLGMGVSGGVEGVLKGPSIMIGGDLKAFNEVKNIFSKITSNTINNSKSFELFGDSNQGHFVKMVHNGIEYVEMQLISSIYYLMIKSNKYKYDDIAKIFKKWSKSDLNSYLLEISSTKLLEKTGGKFLLDIIDDKADDNGTGRWMLKYGVDLGCSLSMLNAALDSRFISKNNNVRLKFSNSIKKDIREYDININSLADAYSFCRLINYVQAFLLIDSANQNYGWEISISKTLNVWSNGSIIKSDLINTLYKDYSVDNILDDKKIFKTLNKLKPGLIDVLNLSLKNDVSLPCFSEALSYINQISSLSLSTKLIQAQRNQFGSHKININ